MIPFFSSKKLRFSRQNLSPYSEQGKRNFHRKRKERFQRSALTLVTEIYSKVRGGLYKKNLLKLNLELYGSPKNVLRIYKQPFWNCNGDWWFIKVCASSGIWLEIYINLLESGLKYILDHITSLKSLWVMINIRNHWLIISNITTPKVQRYGLGFVLIRLSTQQ